MHGAGRLVAGDRGESHTCLSSSPRTSVPEPITWRWAFPCTQFSKTAQSTTFSSVAYPAHTLSSCDYFWEDWKRLSGQRNKDNIHLGGALAASGTLCTEGTRAQAVGHKAVQRYEAPLSFVWKRGFTLAPFMAMLHGHWVRPVNSTHE